MIGRFSSNFIKYLAMGLAFALISFLFRSCEVKAANLSMIKPSRVCVDYISPSSTDCKDATSSVFWDNSYYSSYPRYLGNPGSSSAIGSSVNFQWDKVELCKGKTILVSGYVAGLFGLFDNIYAIQVFNNSEPMICTFSKEDSSRVKFTCSGIGGGKFQVNVNLHSFPQSSLYEVGISQVLDITCDAGNADIITNNNNNTQTIIDNQNKNSNEINNSIKDTNDTMKDDNIDTSSSNSFFNNFKSSDHGLTGIVSAPLKIINQFTTTTCKSVNIDFLGAKADLPCGSTLWGREDLKTFVDIYNVIMGGLISYGALKGIFSRVQDFKNPDDSKVEVIDL